MIGKDSSISLAYLLPNLFTTASIFTGFHTISLALSGSPVSTSWLHALSENSISKRFIRAAFWHCLSFWRWGFFSIRWKGAGMAAAYILYGPLRGAFYLLRRMAAKRG